MAAIETIGQNLPLSWLASEAPNHEDPGCAHDLRDGLICCDEAILSISVLARIQRCIVHQIGGSLKHVFGKEDKATLPRPETDYRLLHLAQRDFTGNGLNASGTRPRS